MSSTEHETTVKAMLDALGIPLELIAQKGMPAFVEAREIVVAEIDTDGFSHHLVPEAATAWHKLKGAAARDDIQLYIVSAFRDLESQAQIIRDKIARGMPMGKILTLSAPPGYSEHHTGRAIDINTPGCEPREAPFENTAAFRWLARYAGDFGFTLSYPPDNAVGFIYEPWHWCFQEESLA